MKSAIEFLQSNAIDLLLLDLNLNKQNGFELLNRFLSEQFHTIIISAHEDKAITAFEYGVLDFVPKPFNEKRLELAFSKLFKPRIAKPTQLKYLLIKNRGKVFSIALDDISYFKGAGIYTEICLNTNRKVLHSKSLDKLMLLLPASYERVHKSYVVNMKQVQNITIHSGGKYEL